MTYAWIQAVHHFMQLSPNTDSFDEFICADERLLDTDVMLTHYNKETLFSDDARKGFVVPDVEAIPQYN
ncbi:MAG: hypothetical protein AB8B49_11580 [Nitratireductor sp.]